VKINAPDLLRKEVKRKKKGRVWMSGVCDPYQPLEAKYKLSRECLDILVQNNWPVVFQTRSSLGNRIARAIPGPLLLFG
jgi:DNA repair photolyase